MQRKLNKERILILVLSVMVMVLAILLMISISKNKKSDKSCTVEEKNSLTNKTKIVCGDDNDISRFMCSRYHENGYIITFKNEIDENEAHNIMNELMSKSSGMPVMYISKIEINAILRNIYGLQDEKDFDIDAFLFVPDHGIDSKNLEKVIKENKSLDKIIEFVVREEKENEKKK